MLSHNSTNARKNCSAKGSLERSRRALPGRYFKTDPTQEIQKFDEILASLLLSFHRSATIQSRNNALYQTAKVLDERAEEGQDYAIPTGSTAALAQAASDETGASLRP